jgi:hypothetical protein
VLLGAFTTAEHPAVGNTLAKRSARPLTPRNRLKLLLSPAERAARWQNLEQKHSPQLIAQARALATMVAYGNDFDSADQLAAAISAYGYEAVSNTTVQVATKSTTNPNRHPDTIVDYLDISRRTR